MNSGLSNAALIAVIAIVPLIILMLTSFVKISVVLALVRHAVGAPDAPSGLVVMGLSLILTFFVMAPVALDMAHAAQAIPSAPAPSTPAVPGPSTPASSSVHGAARTPTSTAPSAAAPSAAAPSAAAPSAAAPSAAAPSAAAPSAAAPSAAAPSAATAEATGARDIGGELRALVPPAYRSDADAAERALVPLRQFLTRHASPRDRETFSGLATRMGRSVQGDEVWVLAPAFLASELREAFAIAVLIFVPFLVIDLVVGLGLAALGLTSTSPQTVALPLKLLLFVSVDGWRLLLDGLLRGYV
jgi:type III secretion protein R